MMRGSLGLICAVLCAGCTTAHAFDPFNNGPDLLRPRVEPQPQARTRHRAARVRGYVRRVARPAYAAPRCQPAIAIVGDQATSEDGAKEQARKAWSQEVRFRAGERFADLRNADEVQFACVRSTIENVANRVTEAVGLNSQLKRCQISARPCMAAFEKELGQ